MTALTHEYFQTVRFAHCDPAGIVFFPQYLVMLNELVEDWFDRGLGISYAQVLSTRRTGLPTVHLDVDFLALSRMGDRLRQTLELARVGRSSAELHVAYHVGEEIKLRIRQVLCCTSLETHRSMPWPDDIRQAMRRYLRADAAR